VFKILNLKNKVFNLDSKNTLKIKDIRKIVGRKTEYDDAKNRIQKYEINIEKIQKYVDLSTSEEWIKDYFKGLSKN
jgi:hypothetical protein|tara:strand:+ start:357 stop:584 length:228 start_codon:yes stop_codon:yes gene_type:complete